MWHCGPRALRASFRGIRNVPMNREVGALDGLEKIKVFLGEGLNVRVFVSICCTCTCILFFGIVAFFFIDFAADTGVVNWGAGANEMDAAPPSLSPQTR